MMHNDLLFSVLAACINFRRFILPAIRKMTQVVWLSQTHRDGIKDPPVEISQVIVTRHTAERVVKVSTLFSLTLFKYSNILHHYIMQQM